jgi:methionyl-tRNA synthetase
MDSLSWPAPTPLCNTWAFTPTGIPTWILFVIVCLVIWEAVWKGIALWKASQNGEKTWFVFLFIFNTLGILPILYIKFFQNRRVAI